MHLANSVHPYYCEPSRWCEHQLSETFESWSDFSTSTLCIGDRDLNLLVRWDWTTLDDEPDAPTDGQARLALFFVLQRKPIFLTASVPVVGADEEAVRAWLTKCARTTVATWSPLLALAEERETWAVVYGNYEPAEVDSTWPTEAEARAREAELDAEKGITGTMWRTVKW